MPEGTYQPNTTESKWQEYWVENETYAYDGERDDDPNLTFAIDTPPPTVSGGLHWGHVYGDTLQDFIARFQRMRGNSVYFPFGYDDNGIASERLTERELGVQRQNFTRQEFQQKCRTVCEQYESTFDEKIQQLGISIDWNQTYQTIEPRVQRLSQLSFLDLYEQGREYRQQAPTICCPDCQTAISQAETEASEQPATYNNIAFPLDGSTDDSIVISTTRPELLPACVAIFVHPSDPFHVAICDL